MRRSHCQLTWIGSSLRPIGEDPDFRSSLITMFLGTPVVQSQVGGIRMTSLCFQLASILFWFKEPFPTDSKQAV